MDYNPNTFYFNVIHYNHYVFYANLNPLKLIIIDYTEFF